MIAKKIIGLTLLASAGIYVAVKKFGKDKPPVTPQTPLDVSKVTVTVSDNPNGGVVYSGNIMELPPGVFVFPTTVSMNGFNLLN